MIVLPLPLALFLQESPPGVGTLLNNPAVVGGGIGGVLALAMLWVMYRSLYRISDRFKEFTESQKGIALAIHESNLTTARSMADTMSRAHEDSMNTVRSIDAAVAKLDLLLDRTNRTFEQMAIHRGVSETAMTGIPPAVVNPGAHDDPTPGRS